MRENNRQVLMMTLRLPDDLQAEALQLLDVSRQAANETLERLWPRLAEFGAGAGPAWKQVTSLAATQVVPHPSRVWRCEAETVGRILRSQAARKAAFDALQPILSEALIVPAEGSRPARKNRRELTAQLTALREQVGQDADKLMLLLNVAEQACNFYLEHEQFPVDYEELQPVPVLEAGVLTFAADDGPQQGQAYRLSLEPERVWLSLKVPIEQGGWRWHEAVGIDLPEASRQLLARGTALAPQLRQMVKADGARIAVLDIPVEVVVPLLPEPDACERVLAFDWGVRSLLTIVVVDRAGQQLSRPFFFDSGGIDGTQSRLRRQIDLLKAKRDPLPQNDPHVHTLQCEIDACWLAFGRRNRALAHLASNLLVVMAILYGCQMIVGEDLASLKTTGRGRDAKGRWRNWRNNTTLRSAITDLLRYKTRLAGLRLRFEFPRGTSHTCPHCGQPAQTFRSPETMEAIDWGAWLRCEACGWNGSRDYAAALNIARLGIAYLVSRVRRAFRMSDSELKPVSYSGAGAALPFPPPDMQFSRLLFPNTRAAIRGWLGAVWLSPWPFLRLSDCQCSDSCT